MVEENENSKYKSEIAFTNQLVERHLGVQHQNFTSSSTTNIDKDFSCFINALPSSDTLDHTSDDYDSDNSSSACTDTSGLTSEISLLRKNFCAIENEISKAVEQDVYDISSLGSVPNFIDIIVKSKTETESFLVTNLFSIVAQFQQWRLELPMIEPFYAVKCNPDPVILKLLASLGCGFDCATMGEINLIVNGLGDTWSFGPKKLARSSIVYANPAKMHHMLQFAVDNDVQMTVFDGEDELFKIATVTGNENLKLLLRLATDDTASVCRFSKKFGTTVDEVPRLLSVAKSLGLRVAGVSFHVGSGCGDCYAYTKALQDTAMVFSEAEKLGMPPLSIIDLGGGFPGDTGGYGGPGMPTFQDIAKAIRIGVASFAKSYKRSISDIRFIAEPGRYFVSASTVISTKIYSRKGGMNKYQALYVDDGVYGSFNNVVYDHAHPIPTKLSRVVTPYLPSSRKLTKFSKNQEVVEDEFIPSAVFGPTCDGLDQMCTLESTVLPRCEVGDWLIWENQGAYTHTASFVFNGYTHVPTKTYCYLSN